MRPSVVVLGFLLFACNEKRTQPPVTDGASASAPPPVPSTASATPAASSAPPLASQDTPGPAASVELSQPPAVRATMADKGKKVTAKVGQTFGVLLPHVDEPFVSWELQKKSAAKLGDPLTTIARGDEGREGRETMWLLKEDAVGTHTLVFEALGDGKKHGRYELTLVVTP